MAANCWRWSRPIASRVGGKVHEHFGFRDSISQPKVVAIPGDRDRVPLGELLLQWPNSRGDSRPATPEPLLENGSFLVIRKLKQDVEGFDAMIARNASSLGIDADLLKAKLIGRYPDGRPLAEKVVPDKLNDFEFENDEAGALCPLESHIRRVNPRTRETSPSAVVPRLARRGLSYGPPIGIDGERGLVFMAYNASIAEQFERIQSWISGGNRSGRYCLPGDPVMGISASPQKRVFCFPGEVKPRRVHLGSQPLVSLRWGLYLFMPSLRALELLAGREGKQRPYPPPSVARGQALLKKFLLRDKANENIEMPDAARLGHWKMLLEDPSTRRYREDVLAAIRAGGGVCSTAYGVIVAGEDLAMEVFRDDGGTFSTSNYRERMQASVGELYLGMDPAHHPEYEVQSREPNKWIYDFSGERAFTDSREQARAWLRDNLLAEGAARHGQISVRRFAEGVFGQLTLQWFGIPDSVAIGEPVADEPVTPEDLVFAGSYIFPPHPTRFVSEQAAARGQAMNLAVRDHLQGGKPVPENTLMAALVALGWSAGDVARTVTGAAMGFVAPTFASFLSVLANWITRGDLWRHQQRLWPQGDPSSQAERGYQACRDELYTSLIRAMQEQPNPSLLHRTVRKPAELGGVSIAEGERVVLAVGSACLEQLASKNVAGEARTAVLFGGNYQHKGSAEGTAHACPGQAMAIAAMLGAVAAVLELPGTLRRKSRLVLTLNEREDGTFG